MTKFARGLAVWILIGSCLPLVSCTVPGVIVREADYSVREIREAIRSLTGEPEKVSENERQFTSALFERSEDVKKPARVAPGPGRSADRPSSVRYVAIYTIVTDRRPFDVRVEVIRHQRRKNAYVATGLDKGLTSLLAEEFRQRLRSVGQGKSFVDEVRPF